MCTIFEFWSSVLRCLLLFLHRFYKLHDQFILTFPIWRFKKDHTLVGRWCWYFTRKWTHVEVILFKIGQKGFIYGMVFIFHLRLTSSGNCMNLLVYPKFRKSCQLFIYSKKKLIALFTWLSMINLTNFEIYETAVVSYR